MTFSPETEKFNVQDALLYAILSYNDEGNENYRSMSYAIDGTSSIGYVFLCYFSQLAFGPARLPCFADRNMNNFRNNETLNRIRDIADSLTAARIDSIVAELRELKAHCGKAIKHGIGSDTVLLKRNVGPRAHNPAYVCEYGATLVRLKLIAEALDEESIPYDMDFINSWSPLIEGHDDFVAGYSGMLIEIRSRFPVDDIIACGDLIGSKRGAFATGGETGDWLTLNRSPTGIVMLDVKDIHFNKEYFDLGDIRSSLGDRKKCKREWDRLTPIRFSSPQVSPESPRFRPLKPSSAGRKQLIRSGLELVWKGLQGRF